MKNNRQKTIIVVGASRGMGRAIAVSAAENGKHVVAVARGAQALSELASSSSNITAEVANASVATTAPRLLARWRPDEVVLCAGAEPVMRSIRDYDWESFAQPFEVDAKTTFHWLRNALVLPMKPQGRIVVFSSGAALHGSALSGGYAPAKQAQRYLANYVRQEAYATRLELQIQVVLPQLNPNTRLGAAAVAGYAAKAGETPEAFIKKRFGSPLTPSIAASAITEMLCGVHDEHNEMMLTGEGLTPLPT